jgi:hypothetical protein
MLDLLQVFLKFNFVLHSSSALILTTGIIRDYSLCNVDPLAKVRPAVMYALPLMESTGIWIFVSESAFPKLTLSDQLIKRVKDVRCVASGSVLFKSFSS